MNVCGIRSGWFVLKMVGFDLDVWMADHFEAMEINGILEFGQTVLEVGL